MHRGGNPRVEESRLRSLELVYVVLVVGEQCPRCLDVARSRELELEADALLVAPAAQLVHLRAQLFRALGGLRSLLDLALERCDSLVTLPECCLVVLTRLGDAVVDLGVRAAACGRAPPSFTCADVPCVCCAASSSTCFVSSCKPSICPSSRSGGQRKYPRLIGASIVGWRHKASNQGAGDQRRALGGLQPGALENEIQIAARSGYGHIELRLGLAFQVGWFTAKPFLHFRRGENSNIAKRESL